jgi:hypothetical protein
MPDESENIIPATNPPESSPPARPRAVIEQELATVAQALAQLEVETNQLQVIHDSLPEDQQHIVDSFTQRFPNEAISAAEISEHPQLQSILLAARLIIKRNSDLLVQQEKLHQELLPYVKAEAEVAIDSLATRVNFDAVFTYYQNLEQRIRAPLDKGDLLDNLATDLFRLRKYQYELIHGSTEDQDFHFYNDMIESAQQFAEGWQKRDILLAEPDRSEPGSTEFGEKVAEARKQIAAEARAALTQLEEYSQLSQTYRRLFTDNQALDNEEIKRIITVLEADSKSTYTRYHMEGFAQIDYDPRFMLAAKKHLDQILLKHQQAGRLPKSSDMRQAERQRVDALPIESLLAELQLKGFEDQEGMRRLFGPADIIDLFRQVIPPDFASRLLEFSCQPPFSRPDENGAETTGRIIATFGTTNDNWDQVVGTKIIVYTDVFIDPDASQVEMTMARQQILNTAMHEFGHNAHYTLDYDEMVAWEKVMREDPVSITWNVEHAKKHDLDPTSGKKEDFADSFMLFISNPALLHVLSPPRYYYMDDFFNRHTPSTQTADFQKRVNAQINNTYLSWQMSGLSTEKVKQMYMGA